MTKVLWLLCPKHQQVWGHDLLCSSRPKPGQKKLMIPLRLLFLKKRPMTWRCFFGLLFNTLLSRSMSVCESRVLCNELSRTFHGLSTTNMFTPTHYVYSSCLLFHTPTRGILWMALLCSSLFEAFLYFAVFLASCLKSQSTESMIVCVFGDLKTQMDVFHGLVCSLEFFKSNRGRGYECARSS
jgi:hypothetical protein